MRFAYHAAALSISSARNVMCHYLNLIFLFFAFFSFSARSLAARTMARHFVFTFVITIYNPRDIPSAMKETHGDDNDDNEPEEKKPSNTSES